jgi:hypothetical protein
MHTPPPPIIPPDEDVPSPAPDLDLVMGARPDDEFAAFLQGAIESAGQHIFQPLAKFEAEKSAAEQATQRAALGLESERLVMVDRESDREHERQMVQMASRATLQKYAIVAGGFTLASIVGLAAASVLSGHPDLAEKVLIATISSVTSGVGAYFAGFSNGKKSGGT